MKRLTHCFLLGAVVVAAGTFTDSAQAQYGGGCGYGDGYYLGFYRSQINSGFDLPPYFSRFPPVYYSSTIIPRPYGWSPFALRARDFDKIPMVASEPLTITNPYMTEPSVQADPTSTLDKSASRPRPKVILNPFVQSGPAVQVANVSP